MSLTDAEILALAVPVLSSAVVMLAAWVNVRSIVRRRERRKQQMGLVRFPAAEDDVLIEIDSEILLQARVGDQRRYFAKPGALKALLARNEITRPHAAE